MWRLLSVMVAVLALAGLTMLHGTTSAGPDPAKKQMVCHHSADTGGDTLIYIANQAVPAHLRNHGDCLVNSEDKTLVGQPCDRTDANNNDICDVQP